MQLKLYSGFSKRINSTKRPGDATITLDGNLREPCSIENPVIQIVPMSLVTAPAAYSYAYIPDFSRYYFVSDWSYNNGLWECSLTEDYLATWKTNIGNTNAYIDRCASEYDGNIIDTQYITTDAFINNRSLLTSDLYFPTINSGCYVVGIINGESAYQSQLGGSVTYYVMEDYELRSLIAYLLSTQFLNDSGFPASQSITQQLSQETAKAFVKPFDFIVSCVWYPFPASSLAVGSSQSIRVGYWIIAQTVATGKLLSSVTVPFHVTGTLPQHPESASRGAYLNFAPYTRVSLTIPPFGTFPLDLSYRTEDKNNIFADVHLDPITGKAQLYVYLRDSGAVQVPNGVIVAEASAELGVPIQLSQISADYIGAIQNIGAAAGSAISGGIGGFLTGGVVGAAVGAIKNALPSVANAISCMSPQVTTKGVDGSTLYTAIEPRVNYQFLTLVDEDNSEMGRPLRKIRKINTLSGFIKCYEVTVDYPCFDSEKASIHDYLLNGFFWE